MKTSTLALAAIFMVALMLNTSSAQEDTPAETTDSAAAQAEENQEPEDEQADAAAAPHQALQYTMTNIDGDEIDLTQYMGKVVVVVNTASRCGLTPQYEQLQDLYANYSEQGVVVLGFPCNQFLAQEPGTEAEIKEFCQKNYGVSFDMFSKIDVNGGNRSELYEYLCSLDLAPAGAGDISWNFEKFILNKSGEPIARFGPRVRPDDEDFMGVIETALAEAGPEVMPAGNVVSIHLPNLNDLESAEKVREALAAKFDGLMEIEIDGSDWTVTFTYVGDEDADAALNSLVEEGSEIFEGWSRK